MESQKCLSCGTTLKGRRDKKFCNVHCKSSYHYVKSLNEPPKFYYMVEKQLKLNRKILKKYNVGGKVTVRKRLLVDDGFNPKFFTHYWKNSNGETYLFVYEYGFMKRVEHGKDKYVLVTWQDYME